MVAPGAPIDLKPPKIPVCTEMSAAPPPTENKSTKAPATSSLLAACLAKPLA